MPNLADFPRIRINFLPTPLVELKRLSRFLGGPRILIKRDDLTGVAMGGNKTRKLEFLLGEALHQGCDTVLACGAMQSNLCRQTAGAAAAAGMDCHLALGGSQPDLVDSNLLLFSFFGRRSKEVERHYFKQDTWGRMSCLEFQNTRGLSGGSHTGVKADRYGVIGSKPEQKSIVELQNIPRRAGISCVRRGTGRPSYAGPASPSSSHSPPAGGGVAASREPR